MCMVVDKEIWEKFENFALSRLHFSPSTIDDRMRKLRYLERHGIDLIDFDEESVYTHFARRIRQGALPSTLNHYVKALNAWVQYIHLDIRFSQYRENEKPIKIPTSKEINLLLKSCKRTRQGKLLKTTVFLFANSGMRISELCNIKLSDVDYHRNTITVMGKGKKTRIIPVKPYVLTGKQYPSLKNYIEHHRYKTSKTYLFTQPNGRIYPKYLRSHFRETVKEVGIGWIHPHSLRHYYATELLRNGVNVKIVQLLLGHANIKTTSRYLHMLENDMFKAIHDVKFDDLLFEKQTLGLYGEWLTNPYGENVYGPGRIQTNQQIEPCQPDPLNPVGLTWGCFDVS